MRTLATLGVAAALVLGVGTAQATTSGHYVNPALIDAYGIEFDNARGYGDGNCEGHAVWSPLDREQVDFLCQLASAQR